MWESLDAQPHVIRINTPGAIKRISTFYKAAAANGLSVTSSVVRFNWPQAA